MNLPTHARNPARTVAAALVVTAALALSACGDDEEATTAPEGTTGAVISGDFELVDDAPDGYGAAVGEASLTVDDSGTTAALEVTGMEPDAGYIAHVHAGTCEQPDPGGPHFQFELGGSEEPPNEIHIEFTTDADGSASAEASNDMQVPEGEANAIVIHLPEEPGDASGGSEGADHGEKAEDGHAHTHSDKLLCATLG